MDKVNILNQRARSGGELYAKTRKMPAARLRLQFKRPADTRGGGVCYGAYLPCGVLGKMYSAVRSRAAYRAGGLFVKSVAVLLEGNAMKVVVVKSPKMFAGLLRMMFGIRKSESA